MKAKPTIRSLKSELGELRRSFDVAVSEPFETRDRSDIKYIAFVIDEELFAWPVGNLREITINRRIVPVPGGDLSVCGAFNYQNQVLPVIDIRHILGLPSRSTRLANILMVTKGLPFETAFAVDRLSAHLSINEADIKSGAVSLDRDIAGIIIGEVFHNGRMVALLNPASI